MSNYGWTNEAGEPIMSGEAYRFEQQLDLDSRDDYYADRFYDQDDYDEGEECPDCGDFGLDTQTGECAFCGYVMGDEPEYVAEDQHLDSYMEDYLSSGAFGD
jgi:hypothetical protein